MKKLFRAAFLAAVLDIVPLHPPYTRRVMPAGTLHPLHARRGTPRFIAEPVGRDLASLTVKELRALATAHRIPGRSKARRKADLVHLLRTFKAR